MIKSTILGIAVLFILLAMPARGQHDTSNWVHRIATDTTVVRCWTDSLTWVALPPNSMNMMMMPDSMYMRIDIMKMDSLRIAHDSTFIGWCRIQAGRDSMRLDMMNTDSTFGTHNMMQFNMAMACQFRWDSLMSDPKHRSWHPTGMRGWNGSNWVTMSGVSFFGSTARFSTSQAFSAFAFVGVPGIPTAVADQRTAPLEYSLNQNYPNPFNPSTTIRFAIPLAGFVTLDVHNIIGERIAVLVSDNLSAGAYTTTFNAGNLASGIYFYRLTSGRFVETRKFVLAK